MSADKQIGLAVDFCGLSFQSPVVLLSGCVGFGNEYTRVQGFSHQDVGAVCLQGTTLQPRSFKFSDMCGTHQYHADNED